MAYLNEKMWAELCAYNKDALLHELDILINSLQEYRKVIEAGDNDTLERLLRDGKERKEKLEERGRWNESE